MCGNLCWFLSRPRQSWFSPWDGILLEYFPNQRCFSEATVRSYGHALNLFVLYLRTEQGAARQRNPVRPPEQVILNLLDWLETYRHCGANTRNHRLMALCSFSNYAGELDCVQLALSMTVQNVPTKTPKSKGVEPLSETVLEVLLRQPTLSKRTELRNSFFMVLMYDTAARCGELLGMKVRDLRFKGSASRRLLAREGQ
jgi:site-specific recombinase XerD